MVEPYEANSNLWSIKIQEMAKGSKSDKVEKGSHEAEQTQTLVKTESEHNDEPAKAFDRLAPAVIQEEKVIA